MTSTAIAKLNLDFDIKKLQKDLETAKQHFQSAPQIGPYHDGSWTGIALRNSKGDSNDTMAFSAGKAQNTEVLEYCPYFKQIIEELNFEVEIARILFVPPGKKVGEHRDQGIDWSTGLARIHIPIVTHEEVYFYIAGERAEWKEGEFWYGNFSEVHSIHNKSDITRVHLVLDCAINQNLLSLFPEEFISEIQDKEDIFVNKDSIQIPTETLKKCCGYFVLPKQYLGLPLLSEIIAKDDHLEIQIFGLPVSIGLNPTAENTFEYLDTKLEYSHTDNNTKTVSITNKSKDIETELEVHLELTSREKILKVCQFILFKIILTAAKPFIKLRRRFIPVKAMS